jgi:hypothetical protein
VLIVTFGWSLWYAAMVWASHAEAPGAYCWPHHHMVRWIGPLGTLVVAGPGAVPGVDTAGPALWPLVPPHAAIPSASAPASAQATQIRRAVGWWRWFRVPNDGRLAAVSDILAIAASLASGAINSIKRYSIQLGTGRGDVKSRAVPTCRPGLPSRPR